MAPEGDSRWEPGVGGTREPARGGLRDRAIIMRRGVQNW